MSDERGDVSAAGSQGVEDELMKLDYARPRVCRRYQQGALWKSVVRVTGGVMVLSALSGYVGAAFIRFPEVLLTIIVLAAVVGLTVMISWERGFVRKQDPWDEGKDRRATTWRASASRYDSSGVTIVDPHAQGLKE
jgi:hypothetical protein